MNDRPFYISKLSQQFVEVIGLLVGGSLDTHIDLFNVCYMPYVILFHIMSYYVILCYYAIVTIYFMTYYI